MQGSDIQVLSARKIAVESKPAEADPLQGQQRYRSLVETTTDWIWEVDRYGRYTFSNQAVADILGYLPEEVLGRKPFDFMVPADAIRIKKVFGVIAAARKPFSGLENTNLHRSGRHVVLETSGVPIFNKKGNFLGFRGIDRDISARKELEEGLRRSNTGLEKRIKRAAFEVEAKRAILQQEISMRKQIQAELTQSEKQFRSLVETLNEGFGILDAESRLTFVNAKLSEMLGRAPSEMLGKKISDFMDERNRRYYRKQLAVRRRGIETPYEIQFATTAGSKITCIVSPRATFDSDGRFQGSFAVITDISAMKTAEKSLRRREHQLREKTLRLQEMNTAMEVLLRKREQDKTIIHKRILVNLRRLVAPYLDALSDTRLSERQRFLVDTLKSNLEEVVSPFSEVLLSDAIDLTKTELEVACLVRRGKSTQQIAAALNISYKTAETHRWRIRKKLGLTRTKANLMTRLARIANPLEKLGESSGKNQV